MPAAPGEPTASAQSRRWPSARVGRQLPAQHTRSPPHPCLPVSVIAEPEAPQNLAAVCLLVILRVRELLRVADGSPRQWLWWVAWLGGPGWPQARTLPGAGALWTRMGQCGTVGQALPPPALPTGKQTLQRSLSWERSTRFCFPLSTTECWGPVGSGPG